MGIEWFRDLSITILGFVTTALLIFAAILIYRLYRTIMSTILLVKATSKIAHDTATMVRDGIKPVISLVTLIQGICGGFEGFGQMFKKESNAGGNNNE
ncbi:MAG: hypothetical protein Q7R50_03070 [Dehalococcoidales bacterium]|nr:hypothetical protein [Dehalococcoidales bacterium]